MALIVEELTQQVGAPVLAKAFVARTWSAHLMTLNSAMEDTVKSKLCMVVVSPVKYHAEHEYAGIIRMGVDRWEKQALG